MGKKENEIIIGFVALIFLLPMWLFLLYSILIEINVDRLVWFIYWCYVPLHILVGVFKGINDALYN